MQSVFSHSDWEPFAQSLQLVIKVNNKPQSLLVKQALPQLASILERTEQAVLHSGMKLSSEYQQLEQEVQELRVLVAQLIQKEIRVSTSVQTFIPVSLSSFYFVPILTSLFK